jgi:hypothetical protein
MSLVSSPVVVRPAVAQRQQTRCVTCAAAAPKVNRKAAPGRCRGSAPTGLAVCQVRMDPNQTHVSSADSSAALSVAGCLNHAAVNCFQQHAHLEEQRICHRSALAHAPACRLLGQQLDSDAAAMPLWRRASSTSRRQRRGSCVEQQNLLSLLGFRARDGRRCVRTCRPLARSSSSRAASLARVLRLPRVYMRCAQLGQVLTHAGLRPAPGAAGSGRLRRSSSAGSTDAGGGCRREDRRVRVQPHVEDLLEGEWHCNVAGSR